jgi:tetratricopeptide (TPR) repeat protein
MAAMPYRFGSTGRRPGRYNRARFVHAVKQAIASIRGSACTPDGGTRPLFQALSAWLDRRRTFRELRSAEGRDSAEFQHLFWNQIRLAEKSFKAGNREYALDLWRKTRARFPTKDSIDLALNLGCYDEAEALMLGADRCYPDSEPVALARGLVRVASLRGDKEEALRRAQTLLRRFPAKPEGYHLTTDCLNRLGRQDEADAVMARGAAKFPTNFFIIEHYARIATQRRLWPEALRRWKLMQGRIDNIAVPLGIARCLREMNHLAEAEKTLADIHIRYKLNDEYFVESANLATAKGDFEAAIRCWQEAIKWNPFSAGAYMKGAAAMRSIGREADADELLCTAVGMCKSDLAIHLEYARSAHRRHDWTAAKERWSTVRDRFPDCSEAGEQEAEALEALGA